jgi:ABC-2 type transport system ATP-binding protein
VVKLASVSSPNEEFEDVHSSVASSLGDFYIDTKSVSKIYDGCIVVDELSFKLQPGEFVSILGPNGAGKTTLLEMIIGIRTPTTGDINVLRKKPEALSKTEKQNIGVLLQTHGLPAKLTVGEYLEMVAAVYRVKVLECSLMSQLGINSLLNKRLEKLSGGQLRKVSIFSALFSSPALMILDEPTASLDPHARLAVWRELKKMCSSGSESQASSVLLSTHDMREATELSDRVLIMDAGRIVAQGSPEELIQKYCSDKLVRVCILDNTNFMNRVKEVDSVLQPKIFSEYSVDGPYAVFDASTFEQSVELIGSEFFMLKTQSFHQPTLEDVFVYVTKGGSYD